MIAAADIGGTNCRMALFEIADGNLELVEEIWAATGSIPHTEALLAAFERELKTEAKDIDAVVAAIGGPVANNEKGKLTNADLELDFSQFNKDKKRFFLINDFIAQAYAALSPVKDRHIAGPETGGAYGTRAVIGAGTGLGQAMLVSTPAWMAIPSENGHAVFPFLGQEEQKFNEFLQKELGIPFASGDDAIAGRGLACLHHFLTGEKLSPAQVGATALQSPSQTQAWYSRLYARACKNWMLATLCSGGLWIAGGIAAQNPLVATSPEFFEELYNHPRWEGFLRSVPVYLMEKENSGLWGAAVFGLEQVNAAR